MPEKISSVETNLYHKQNFFFAEQDYFVAHIDLLTTRQSWKELLNWIRWSYYKNTFFFQEQHEVVQKHKMHKHYEEKQAF